MNASVDMPHSLKDRDSSFDAFRGIAIIAVVAIHAIPWEYYRDYVVLSYRQVLNFAVPSFLFISGYWLSKKSIRSIGDYKSFLQKRLSRILIPYIFWSVVFLLYENNKTHNVSVTQILSTLLAGTASFHCYFVVVIAQLYMLTPLLNYVNRKPYGFISVLIFNIVSLFVLYLLSLGDLWFVDDPYYLIHSPFLLWIIFYQMGLLIGSSGSEGFIPRNMHKFILPAVLVALVVSVLEVITILSKYDNWHRAICAIKYSSFIYSTCIIFGFLALRERLKKWPRFLVVLGNYSFGIYLIHVIILRGVVRIMPKVDTIYSFQVLYGLMAVLITLIMCYVLITIARKLLPKLFYSRILGF